MARIHPSAIVDPKAELAEGVEVGPFSLIGPHVKIGKDVKIANHVTIEGHTQIGARCQIYSYACLGSHPQVRKQPAKSYLKIGDDNILREYVTMNPSMYDEASTVVGNGNFIMMNVHVAHDCVLGDDITIANGVGLSGHVTIEEKVTIGGLTGIHQYVRVGKHSMIGGVSKVVTDVAPFSTCDGHPAVFYGINTLGLKRAGFSPADRLIIRKVLKMLLASGQKISTAIEEVKKEFPKHPQVDCILNFIKNTKRGVARAKSEIQDDEES